MSSIYMTLTLPPKSLSMHGNIHDLQRKVSLLHWVDKHAGFPVIQQTPFETFAYVDL